MAESSYQDAEAQPCAVRWLHYTGLAALVVVVGLVALANRNGTASWVPLALAAGAFGCEFIDSSLGMGYGTTFTPLLVLLGFDLKRVVPVILLSEFCTGLAAGGAHHALGNASFRWKSRDTNVALALAVSGIAGALAAVHFISVVPGLWARLYFALMITAMGVLILLRQRNFRFSWAKIGGLGLLSAFNKGMSGGGYGPLIVGGQVLSGCEPRNAVACTSLSESLICLVALAGYAARHTFPDPTLAIPIVAGALLSAPCASLATRVLSDKGGLRRLVGLAVLVLGLVCLLRVKTGGGGG